MRFRTAFPIRIRQIIIFDERSKKKRDIIIDLFMMHTK